jgi:hypothetical protein
VREAFDAIVIDGGQNGTAGDAIATTRIFAEGICCPSEVPLIRRILEPLAGVSQASITQPRSCDLCG